jgi:hypothetical protein
MATKKTQTKKAEPKATAVAATVAATQAPAATPNPGGQVAGLSLTDLVTVTQIIQLSSQRGAFRAEEMASVGTLYTKLVAFLQQSGALNPATPEEEKKDA